MGLLLQNIKLHCEHRDLVSETAVSLIGAAFIWENNNNAILRDFNEGPCVLMKQITSFIGNGHNM